MCGQFSACACLAMLLFAAEAAVAQAPGKQLRPDTLNANALVARFVESRSLPVGNPERVALSNVVHRAMTTAGDPRGPVLQRQLTNALVTTEDSQFFIGTARHLFLFAAANQGWNDASVGMARRYLEGPDTMKRSAILLTLRSASPEIQERVLPAITSLLLSSADYERQQFVAEAMLSLGEAGGNALDELIASDRLDARLVSWIEFIRR